MATHGKKMISMELDVEMIERLDRLAENCGVSRHQLMKNFIESCTIEGEFLRKFGILYTAKRMKAFFEIGKEAFEADARQEKLVL